MRILPKLSSNLTESSKEGYSSNMALLLMMIIISGNVLHISHFVSTRKSAIQAAVLFHFLSVTRKILGFTKHHCNNIPSASILLNFVGKV
jgi:hypothetical protein